MDKQRKKELLEDYKNIKTYMGITQIKNRVNGKIYVAGYPNLKNKWESIKGQLNLGMHVCTALQQDWKQQEQESFEYTVLEQKATDKIDDVRWELKQMEKQWLQKLQPYGENGYNRKKD